MRILKNLTLKLPRLSNSSRQLLVKSLMWTLNQEIKSDILEWYEKIIQQEDNRQEDLNKLILPQKVSLVLQTQFLS